MKTLTLTILLSVAPCLHAANQFFLNPVPSPAVVHVGETLTLNVDIFSDDTVFGFQFDLLYPNFLTIDPSGISEGGFFQANGCCFSVDPSQIDNAGGRVSSLFDAIVGPAGLQNALDTVLQLRFLVAGPGTGSFGLENIILTDDSFNGLPVDAVLPVDVTSTLGTPAPEPGGAVALVALGALILGTSVGLKPLLALKQAWEPPKRPSRCTAAGSCPSWRSHRLLNCAAGGPGAVNGTKVPLDLISN